MRFRKGSKVEVFCSDKVPSGVWRCAEIVSGNGHNYTVQYMGQVDDAGEERVSRKVIRPYPPPVDCVVSWMAGDILEVFDDFSWRTATILKVLGGEYYLVRLVGSSTEFQVHKIKMRVRQSWQDQQWVLVGKVINVFHSFIHNNYLLSFHRSAYF